MADFLGLMGGRGGRVSGGGVARIPAGQGRQLGILQFASNLGKCEEDEELESIGPVPQGTITWTDNDVKNYWNTKLKKKLSAMGIDPVTHMPFSQMLQTVATLVASQEPKLE
ncbi:hypothetical protein Tco_0723053 [Tanacetum coccineum]